MRPTFPLGLKIPLWFLLNIVALSALAGFALFAQVGLGWGMVLRGQAEARIHAMAEVVMTELVSAEPGERAAVLTRLGGAYRMQFTLWRNDGRRVAGTVLDLPAPVIARLEERRQRSEGPPPEDGPEDGAERRRLGPQGPDEARGLFLVRAGADARYWIGIRVPWGVPGRPPVPATLIATAPSLASLAVFFDWTPWLWDMAGAVVISGLFWWPFVRGLTRSVAELSRAADRIAEGRLDTRVSTRRRDEIGALGASVNRMAERLELLVAAQKRFLADAAHELSSPLARLQIAVGILEERVPEPLQSALNDVREEAQEMSALTGALLDLTRAELAPPAAAAKAVELAPLVKRVMEREGRAGGVGIAIPAGLAAWADPILLQRALANLVRNANRYASGSAAEIVARAEGAEVVIEVLDRGPGVPENELVRLGEPFYRPESARTRETGGTGLGLAIVRNCAIACGGSARFSNRADGGFRAEIRLRGAATPT